MRMSRKASGGVLSVVALLLSVRPAPEVQATSIPGLPGMVWMATANWLNCEQNGPTPECADYGTPSGGMVQMTCCVPRNALGTSDMSACSDQGGLGRARTEL